MAIYLITGANRGLGYGFVQVLAKDSSNTIVGLVRDKATADKKLAADGFKNVTFVEAAITDRKSLLAARDEVDKLTGGRVDYLINNAALVVTNTEAGGLDDFEDRPEILEADLKDSFEVNVIGPINTINVFLPLIKKSSIKKVVVISTGMADADLINSGVVEGGPYAISKAAVNTAVYKYNAKYKSEGILFFAISPGVVDTWGDKGPPAAIETLRQAMPGWSGPLTALESAQHVLKVTHDFSVENGNGGSFVSHYGTKQWL